MATMPRQPGIDPDLDGEDDVDDAGYDMEYDIDEDDWDARSHDELRRFRDQDREDWGPKRRKRRRRSSG
ncbi:MAG: hypothetical protein ACREVN_06810 [Gammaproteobacteria bacterium]